jgi:hypothetical protein
MNLIQRLSVAPESYWDEVLTEDEEKNPFPLAPSDAVKAGQVDRVSYLNQNTLLAQKSTEVMSMELSGLVLSQDFERGPRKVEVLGAGLMRDLNWLAIASAMSFELALSDSSSVACKNASRFFEDHRIRATVRHMEVEDVWRKGLIDEENVSFYYAGQFIQNQNDETMERMMRHLGRFLKMSNRRLYLLHPRGEDNPAGRVHWKNTKPYYDIELKAPVEKGLGGPVRMEVIAKHFYFHQHYSFFRFSKP